MRTTDRGLQKAIKRQPHYELPSNFSYRMMQKIQEESILREKRQEKRMFILFLVFAILSGGSCIGFFIWKYGAAFISYWHTCKEILPDSHTLLFYLPTLCALCLLYFFDRWLRKKMHKTVKKLYHTKNGEPHPKFALSISISVRNLISDSFPTLLPGTYG